MVVEERIIPKTMRYTKQVTRVRKDMAINVNGYLASRGPQSSSACPSQPHLCKHLSKNLLSLVEIKASLTLYSNINTFFEQSQGVYQKDKK